MNMIIAHLYDPIYDAKLADWQLFRQCCKSQCDESAHLSDKEKSQYDELFGQICHYENGESSANSASSADYDRWQDEVRDFEHQSRNTHYWELADRTVYFEQISGDFRVSIPSTMFQISANFRSLEVRPRAEH